MDHAALSREDILTLVLELREELDRTDDEIQELDAQICQYETCLYRRQTSDCSRVHREQASAGRNGDTVTRDALAVDTPLWMVGDRPYDTLRWHDLLLTAGVVPVAPDKPRNTDDQLDIEYRVQEGIENHDNHIQLNESVLNKTYKCRTQVERTNEAVKDCGLGHVRARGRFHARAQVFLAWCLRLVVAITNYERGDNPGSTLITVCQEFYDTL